MNTSRVGDILRGVETAHYGILSIPRWNAQHCNVETGLTSQQFHSTVNAQVERLLIYYTLGNDDNLFAPLASTLDLHVFPVALV